MSNGDQPRRGAFRGVSALVGAIVVAAAAAALSTAPAASAEPDSPCEGVATVLCQFLPIAPDLEGDVDMTGQMQLTGSTPGDNDPVPDYNCSMGCI